MINWLFPKKYKCVVCGKEIKSNRFEFCNDCYSELPFIEGKLCLKCGEPINSKSDYCMFCKKQLPSFYKCFSVFEYTPPISGLIYKLKYSGNKYLAHTLSACMLKYFLEQNVEVDVVIPIPLHIERFKSRGFNQSELLCKAFEKVGFNVDVNSTERIKNTVNQTSLSKSERNKNVEDAFRVVDKNAIKDKVVLLVDDVYTTGATFNSLTKILLSKGAKQVYCLTLAHTCLEKSMQS